MRRLFDRLRWFATRRQREAELQAELEFHLEQETAEARERGLTDDDARRAGSPLRGTLAAPPSRYGVLAYSVVRRRREIGLRVAVGARPGSIERMFLKESLMTWPAASIWSSTARSSSLRCRDSSARSRGHSR